MAKKQGNLNRRLFPVSPRISLDFFIQKGKKNKKTLILSAKTCFYGNSRKCRKE